MKNGLQATLEHGDVRCSFSIYLRIRYKNKRSNNRFKTW